MRKYNIFLLLALGLTLASFGQSDSLDALVASTAQRLELAKTVALAKWDSGGKVEDPAREKQVIENAEKDAQAKGLDPAAVGDFFRAQIEANKLIQYSLLSGWLAEGKAPPHGPVDLAKQIRPQLDAIQIRLIDELAKTADLRSDQSCGVRVARAVAEYVGAHKLNPDSRDAVAIERAMGATCTH
jgi:chorismate mutase